MFCTFFFQVTVSTSVSVGAVKDVVSNAVSLQKSGAISTDMLALLFKTISDNMNSSYSQNDKEMVMRYFAFRQTLNALLL